MFQIQLVMYNFVTAHDQWATVDLDCAILRKEWLHKSMWVKNRSDEKLWINLVDGASQYIQLEFTPNSMPVAVFEGIKQIQQLMHYNTTHRITAYAENTYYTCSSFLGSSILVSVGCRVGSPLFVFWSHWLHPDSQECPWEDNQEEESQLHACIKSRSSKAWWLQYW